MRLAYEMEYIHPTKEDEFDYRPIKINGDVINDGLYERNA